MKKHKVLTSKALMRYSGMYADGWTFGTCSFELNASDKPADLIIEGTIPLLSDQNFATELTVRLDGQEAAKQIIKPGDFKLCLTCLPNIKAHKVELKFSITQILPIPDVRQIGALLRSLVFKTPSTEIFSSAGGIDLGENWHPVETWEGETFRWVTNNAELSLNKSIFSMEVEPGPGLSSAPFDLHILDADNRLLAKARVRGREIIAINTLKPTTKVKLYIEGGGKPAPNETRLLNFRVFQIYTN